MTSSMNAGAFEHDPKAEAEHTARVWAEFERRFPANEASLKEITKFFEELKHVLCPRCSHVYGDCEDAERRVKCRNCGFKFWFTARTFFRRVKHIRAWHGAFWLLEHGARFNALDFCKMVGNIAYSTALNIVKKVMAVVESMMPKDAASAPSNEFSELMIRRTRDTPAGEDPLAEELQLASEPGETDVQTQASPGVNETAARASAAALLEIIGGLAREIFEMLELKSMSFEELMEELHISADELSSVITEMELSRLVVRLPGNYYGRAAPPSPTRTAAATASARAILHVNWFIKGLFQGIGRKYLPLYLARHWVQFDRQRWNNGKLMRLCIEAMKMLDEQLVQRSCPRTVRFVPAVA